MYVATSLEECARRDVKGLYAKAFSGEIKEFTGVSDPYEAPQQAEIVVETEGRSPEESAAFVIVRARAPGHHPPRARGGCRLMASSTTARKSGSLIAPHGGELIDRTVTGDEAAALAEEAAEPAARAT